MDAILAAGPVLVACADLDREPPARAHPFPGAGNVHGSLVDGSTEESTIPDRCVFTVERRILPGETLDIVESKVGDFLDRCRRADPNLTVSARTTLAREPSRRWPARRLSPRCRRPAPAGHRAERPCRPAELLGRLGLHL
ncbi:MAG: peptidase dimerization domain-containing protein [Actinomycetota bacterium]|nr:peptidase dimerization domain-containing protein [Actinomycetota bacterium]